MLDLPLHANLEAAARDYPEAEATIFLNRALTYRELDMLATKFANALVSLGVSKGDRVALYLANCPQFIIGYYGALKAGATVVPCNPLYVAREIEHQVNDSGAETILVMSSFYNTVKGIRGNAGLKNVIVTNVKECFPPLLKALFTVAK